MLLPTQLPVDPNNMNYTCVTVGAVMILVMGAWYLPYWGAKNWVSSILLMPSAANCAAGFRSFKRMSMLDLSTTVA